MPLTTTAPRAHASGDLRLTDGSSVAVVGGGPAGSFFSIFLLRLCERTGLALDVDLYEPRDFLQPAPQGCNMCGGIVSESLVQNLAVEGINLPPSVIQRGINSYVLHTDDGSVRIELPLHEKRIGAVYRGAGPRDVTERKWQSFDGHLLEQAVARGAKHLPARVEDVGWQDGRPWLKVRGGEPRSYDLVAVAIGVNSSSLKLFEKLDVGYCRPATTKTLIREYRLGEQAISDSLGSSMHVFLLNLPRLEFAALIPKGDYVTMCLLGEDIDSALGDEFAGTPAVRAVMPPGWLASARSCQCLPRINVKGVDQPYADRLLFIGDCGITRLYKDGIGAAYRTAKSAARAAVLDGISEAAFRRHYRPVCRSVAGDNLLGGITFRFTRQVQHSRLLRQAVIRAIQAEQRHSEQTRRLSGILWDMFSGSAPYRDIFRRMLNPGFLLRLASAIAASAVQERHGRQAGGGFMSRGELGKLYRDGEVIVRQGEVGDAMYVIQEGKVEILLEKDGRQVRIRVAGKDELIGEMAVFEHEARSATVRALGEARVLTVDRQNFLLRINEDSSLAFRLVETMSHRVRELSQEIARLKTEATDRSES
jgi:CRP-like cAMP-binding protein/flavin-dependent dehydrogenase